MKNFLLTFVSFSMPTPLFAILTTVMFLVIPYIFEESVPYSYIIYTLYGMCIFITAIYIGMNFHKYKSEKQGK